MSATHTHERILKLHDRGLTPESIARKIGRPNDVPRVLQALAETGRQPHKPAPAGGAGADA